MARGGRRVGRSGANYGNRRDLQLAPRQPVQAAPGQQYGARVQQERQQQALPLPRTTPTQPGVRAPQAAPSPPPAALDAPTQTPGEPVTAGSAFGAGPGPEVLGMGRDTTADEIRALYRAFPNNDLRALVEALDSP